MKKLYGLAIIFLLSISVLAVFSEALYSGANAYVSQSELSAQTLANTGMHMEYVRGNLMKSSKPKTMVYHNLHGVVVVQGESVKIMPKFMTSTMYHAQLLAEAGMNKLYSENRDVNAQTYISHNDLTTASAENSAKQRDMGRTRIRSRVNMMGY